MSTRMTNLFLGVMAMSLGAAGGGIWASGEPVTPVPVEAVVVETPPAVEATPVVDTAAPAEKAAPADKSGTDVPPCCRKGQGKCCKGKAAHAPAVEPPAPAAKPAAPAAADASESYVCPMHPEVTSSRKEDRCPKCGMFLEAAKK